MKLTVKQICDMIDNKELFYDQTTQRQFIYSASTVNTPNGEITRAGNVIRSILYEKLQLPALFFWEREDGKYNIHDGKQRILSLYYFCNPRNKDNIQIVTRLDSEYTFTNLSESLKNELLNYKFDIVVKKGIRELEERSFDLINTNSVPLTDYECIRGLSYGKWFKGFEDFLISKGQIYDKIPKQINRGEETLFFLLAYFRLLNDPSWREKIRYLLNICRNSEFNSKLNNYYEKIDIYNDIAKASNCAIPICLQIADMISTNKWDPKPIIEYYFKGNKVQNDFKKWKIDEHKIAITNLMVNNICCCYMRFFGKNDKDALYKLKPKCSVPNCNITNYSDLVIDHIKPWSDGGETTLKNAQLLCKKHNSSKKSTSYESWIEQQIINKPKLAKKVEISKKSYRDAWIEFEVKAKPINNFEMKRIKNNTKINVERINDVASKINLTETQVELLHNIRKIRNEIEHPKELVLNETRFLDEKQTKCFNEIIKTMDDYLDR